jgi:hypothetical protein
MRQSNSNSDSDKINYYNIWNIDEKIEASFQFYSLRDAFILDSIVPYNVFDWLLTVWPALPSPLIPFFLVLEFLPLIGPGRKCIVVRENGMYLTHAARWKAYHHNTNVDDLCEPAEITCTKVVFTSNQADNKTEWHGLFDNYYK